MSIFNMCVYFNSLFFNLNNALLLCFHTFLYNYNYPSSYFLQIYFVCFISLLYCALLPFSVCLMAATLKPSETTRLTGKAEFLFTYFLHFILPQSWGSVFDSSFMGFSCSKPSQNECFDCSVRSFVVWTLFQSHFCCVGCRNN